MYSVVDKVIYDNLEWYRYPNANRWNDRQYYCRGSLSLHRYVWEKFNGKIPKGMVIHHKDGNCQNNDISNLECLSPTEHISVRHKPEGKRLNQLRDNLNKNARPKAIEWHKSEAAKEFHKWLGKKSWENFEPTTKKCIVCGKEFLDKSRQQTGKYCCGACSSKALRKVKAMSTCVVCGKQFETNKYYPSKCCSSSCAGKLSHQTRKNKKEQS